MLFTKIKAKGSRIHLEWEESKGAGEPDEHVLRSNERPRPEFIDSFLELRQAVIIEAELPDEMLSQITPSGLSLSYYDDGRMGAVITGIRKLQNSNSPLVINTPHKPDAPANDNDQTPLLSVETSELIDVVVREAVLYVQGDRAEKPLDFDGAEEESREPVEAAA